MVFSNWTKTLAMVEKELDARDIRYVRLDGSLTPSARSEVIGEFRADPVVSVFLVTISCGGVG